MTRWLARQKRLQRSLPPQQERRGSHESACAQSSSRSCTPRRRATLQTYDGLARFRTNSPKGSGAWEGIRTLDLRITNALLYRLSYPGAESKISPSSIEGSGARIQNSINENIRSWSNKDSSIFVERRRFASATASIARNDAPTRYSLRASPPALVSRFSRRRSR